MVFYFNKFTTTHPFQPLYLTEVLKESPLELPKLLPAFFLKANEDKAFWSNVITAIEYTVDIVTTLSGVGNIAKFRYLARLGEAGSLIAKIKLGEGIAEVINVFKIDDKRWMYYDEQGKPLKEHNLFLPGIENILAFQEVNKSNQELSASKTNSEAISKITALENALKNQRKNVGKATFFKKIIDQLLYMLSRVKDFLKDPLQQPLEAIETSFVIYNAFIVGLINSIVDAIKGIFDMIALICQGLIALKDKAIDMAQNLTSYFSLLFEMIENQIETIANIFNKENLNALFAFFKKCGILALTLPAKLFSWISEGVEMPNLDKIAYYMGYLIGFIIQLILEILFTGGAKTVADAFAKLAESLMALFKTLKTVAFKLKKGAVIAFENLLGIFAYIREKSKNLKSFLDELWEIIQGWFKKGKADDLSGMAEDISRGIKISVEEFKAGLVKLSKINAEEALEHLDEALIYFNHHIIDGKIVQISDRNCLNVVQVVDEFLKSGKITIAKSSEAQSYHVLEEIYGSKFLTYNFSTLNKIIIDGERGILLCERGYGKLSHVINILKKDGKLIFKDGQVHSQEMNLLREFKTFKYLKTY